MEQDTSRRGRKPSPERRDAIIAAALTAFATQGVEVSTTRHIAEAAGTTERTLFKHFGSKDGLVQAVIEAAAIELLREGAFARVQQTAPFTRAEFRAWHQGFLTERVESASKAPENYRVIFRELLRDNDFRKGFSAKWTARVFLPLAGHLQHMQDAGEIKTKLTAAELAGAFYSLNISYLFTRFTLMPELSWGDEEAIDAVVRMFQTLCGNDGL